MGFGRFRGGMGSKNGWKSNLKGKSQNCSVGGGWGRKSQMIHWIHQAKKNDAVDTDRKDWTEIPKYISRRDRIGLQRVTRVGWTNGLGKIVDPIAALSTIYFFEEFFHAGSIHSIETSRRNLKRRVRIKIEIRNKFEFHSELASKVSIWSHIVGWSSIIMRWYRTVLETWCLLKPVTLNEQTRRWFQIQHFP